MGHGCGQGDDPVVSSWHRKVTAVDLQGDVIWVFLHAGCLFQDSCWHRRLIAVGFLLLALFAFYFLGLENKGDEVNFFRFVPSFSRITFWRSYRMDRSLASSS
ncbi:hypothetical protein DM01DRAFT_1141325 [Hesseltinella vesiculosa]|uniref:Uncharacterized protein n=1 Tax=Hesseltinella vesiculosa TaxID=101127 RepID=A0A1X2G893_9FUNG|nr:hypothetical protein DM01DRAFT_1141325 [Hesseltinella vesiculosa]